jgi:hypothetical protein
MITGLRAADAPLIQRLVQGDMKLLLRLGALLQDGLAVSEAALQSLVASGVAGDKGGLLLDRRLKTITAEGFPALAKEFDQEDLLLTTAADGVRVIALSDELGNLLTAALQPVQEAAPAGINAVVAQLAPSLRGPVEGLLAARADDQRAAALEQLRYAMPPLPVVCELMPMLLADGAEMVRERAIALLMASGAHVAVVDAIRAIQRGDDVALARQAEPLSRLPAAQQELAIAAVLAQLSRGLATPGLVTLTRGLAPVLAGHASLERLFELLLPRKLSLLELVRELQLHDRERVDALLTRNLGLDVDQDAQLIVLLAAPTASPVTSPAGISALLTRGLGLLLAAEQAPRERMALAAALRRLDAFLADRPLAGMLAHIEAPVYARAFDTSVYWLLADLCRDGVVSTADGELLATTCRRLLREAGGPHLIALLEQQLPALLPASPAARLALVEPTVETVARFHDDRSREVVAACVVSLGVIALSALWEALADHPRLEVRLLCIELIGDLTIVGGTATTPAIERLLTAVNRVVETGERTALVVAAARLVAADPAATVELHGRVLAATNGLGDQGLLALGPLVASTVCASDIRLDLTERLLRTLQENVPDAPVTTETDLGNLELTYILDDALTRHTDAIPQVLRALAEIGAAATVAPELQHKIMERMCRQWRRVAAWEIVWGPGNIRELGETIAALAERRECPPSQRVQAAEALLIAANQLTIARALARVFISGTGTYLSTLAGRAAARLVQLAAEDYYADDERADLVEVMVDFLAIADLGKEDQHLRRRLINLIANLQPHATSRARLRLRYLRESMDATMQDRLGWA